jgi:hypothetical protein
MDRRHHAGRLSAFDCRPEQYRHSVRLYRRECRGCGRRSGGDHTRALSSCPIARKRSKAMPQATRGIAERGCGVGLCANQHRGSTINSFDLHVQSDRSRRIQRTQSRPQPLSARTCPTRGTLFRRRRRKDQAAGSFTGREAAELDEDKQRLRSAIKITNSSARKKPHRRSPKRQNP